MQQQQQQKSSKIVTTSGPGPGPTTSSKVIYVKISNRIESIEFNPSTTSSEDLKETLRAAAEACSNDIVKLYNARGNMVSVAPLELESNSLHNPYKLEVVVKSMAAATNDDVESLRELVRRIEHVETQLHSSLSVETDAACSSSDTRVNELYSKVKELCVKLENMEHLSWIGLFKTTHLCPITKSFLPDKKDKKEKIKYVYEQFKKYSLVEPSEETRQYLRKPSFDNWKFEDAEMLALLQYMFVDLGFTTRYAIKIETLQDYLFEVYSNYNDVPFHNFRHAFVVTQMMYGLILITDAQKFFDPLEIFCMVVSAVSHDLDHDGYNNSFQINARTQLALIYNDQSPLENYHCAVAFHILTQPHCNILAALDYDMYKKFRHDVIQVILATDMTHHNSILNKFRDVSDKFDFKNQDHRISLMKIYMKTSDISNECRPVSVSEVWLDLLLAEFFNQGDHEKLKGLPLSPLMDRDNFSKSTSQIGFISYVLLPMAEEFSKVFPQVNDAIIKPAKKSLDYYKEMKLKENEQLNNNNNNK